MGIDQSHLSRIERGKARMTPNVRDKAAAYYQVPAGWLEEGEGALPDEYLPVPEELLEPVERSNPAIHYEAEIPRVSSGPGAANGEGITKPTILVVRDRGELHRLTGINPSRLRPLWIEGDSNVPDLVPQTSALYLPQDRITVPGIYVIDLDGDWIAKQVEKVGGGALMLSSRNKEAYPDKYLFTPLEDADTADLYRSDLTGLTVRLRIIGRILVGPPKVY